MSHLKSVYPMKNRLNLVLFLLSFSFFGFSKTVTLQEALQKKWVSTTVSMQSNEAARGCNMHISIKNLTKSEFNITIPVGFVFQSLDSTAQDFIHLENKELGLAALATQSTYMMTRCIRANRGFPNDNQAFLAKSLASSQLLALATFAFEKKRYESSAMQSALWAVSDNQGLYGINDSTLLNFVAHLLNKPLPDYTVNYKIREEAGMTAESALEPLAIEGVFQYTLPADMQVKLDLVNAAGVSVLKDFKMIEIMTQKKGRHRFSFTLELKGVARGTYFMKMTSVSDGKEWGSKQVVF